MHVCVCVCILVYVCLYGMCVYVGMFVYMCECRYAFAIIIDPNYELGVGGQRASSSVVLCFTPCLSFLVHCFIDQLAHKLLRIRVSSSHVTMRVPRFQTCVTVADFTGLVT